MPAKPQDAKRIARPERQHVVDRYTREKRPHARAERQGRFESTLQLSAAVIKVPQTAF